MRLASLNQTLSQTFSLSRLAALFDMDVDLLLFKSLLAVIILIAVWPLGFLAYLMVVYGSRIMVW